RIRPGRPRTPHHLQRVERRCGQRRNLRGLRMRDRRCVDPDWPCGRRRRSLRDTITRLPGSHRAAQPPGWYPNRGRSRHVRLNAPSGLKPCERKGITVRIARFVYSDEFHYGVVLDETITLLANDPLYAGIVPTTDTLKLDDVRLVTPVLPRSKVIGVGRNWEAHAQRSE